MLRCIKSTNSHHLKQRPWKKPATLAADYCGYETEGWGRGKREQHADMRARAGSSFGNHLGTMWDWSRSLGGTKPQHGMPLGGVRGGGGACKRHCNFLPLMECGESSSHTHVTRSPTLIVVLCCTPSRHRRYVPAGKRREGEGAGEEGREGVDI